LCSLACEVGRPKWFASPPWGSSIGGCCRWPAAARGRRCRQGRTAPVGTGDHAPFRAWRRTPFGIDRAGTAASGRRVRSPVVARSASPQPRHRVVSLPFFRGRLGGADRRRRAKLLVALGQGRGNVGFLVALLVVAGIVAWKLVFKYRTVAGDAALASMRSMFDHLRTRASSGAVCGAALQPTIGRGWIDVARGVFYRRADGERETKKRKPAVPLPPELHDHLRRWKRRGQRFAVEWYGEPVTSRNCPVLC
jgi:hypothetical protein